MTRKKLKKLVYYFLLVVLIAVLGLAVFILQQDFRKTDEDITKVLEKSEIHYLSYNQDSLRYARTGNADSNTAILFIHGTPGGLDAFNPYLRDKDLHINFDLFSVDRIGYGFSKYGKIETSIAKQAEPWKMLIEKYPDKKWVIVGHSYGGVIASYIAHQIPEKIKEVILLGAAVDKNYENFTQWAKLTTSFPIKYIASNAWLVASEEKKSHPTELEKVEFIWKNISFPVTVIHGKKDNIVPYANAVFLQERVPKEYINLITLQDNGHIFVFTKPEILKKLLLKGIKE